MLTISTPNYATFRYQNRPPKNWILTSFPAHKRCAVTKLLRSSTTSLGRAWYPQNSPRAGRPKLKSNPGEYFRPSPLRRLQPSHRYQNSHTSPNLHGFWGLNLLVHRINLILPMVMLAVTLDWESSIIRFSEKGQILNLTPKFRKKQGKARKQSPSNLNKSTSSKNRITWSWINACIL